MSFQYWSNEIQNNRHDELFSGIPPHDPPVNFPLVIINANLTHEVKKKLAEVANDEKFSKASSIHVELSQGILT